MKLAAAALALVFLVPGLAQSQAPAPPYLLDPGESPPVAPPPPSTPGAWPLADGSGVGLRHSSCPTTNPPLYTGPTTITVNGTRIFNARISSQLTISADNVKIECAEIQAPGSGRGIQIDSGSDGAVISKVRIHNIATNTATKAGKGIYFRGGATNLVVEYSEFFDAEDGIHSEGNGAVISYNWFHDNKNYAGLHKDPIAVASGTNIMIRNNRFGPFPDVSATIMVQPAGSCPTMNNIDIVNNFVGGDGNGNTILLDRSVGCACPTGIDILNNRYDSNITAPVQNGSGDKACPSVTQRGGSCTGNLYFNGSPAGC